MHFPWLSLTAVWVVVQEASRFACKIPAQNVVNAGPAVVLGLQLADVRSFECVSVRNAIYENKNCDSSAGVVFASRALNWCSCQTLTVVCDTGAGYV